MSHAMLVSEALRATTGPATPMAAARNVNGRATSRLEDVEDFGEAVECAGLIDAERDRQWPSRARLEEPQQGLCAADIASQDHY